MESMKNLKTQTLESLKARNQSRENQGGDEDGDVEIWLENLGVNGRSRMALIFDGGEWSEEWTEWKKESDGFAMGQGASGEDKVFGEVSGEVSREVSLEVAIEVAKMMWHRSCVSPPCVVEFEW
ncbi:hypothetical protein M0R45_006362 [Rubus argutus]|uniref:Uncharacterized protein n=1 Tax=Rubus argutus TaxID=59490 RepID=A0AAW1YQC9_RUBAR